VKLKTRCLYASSGNGAESFYTASADFGHSLSANHLNATYPSGLNAAVIMMAIAIADFDGKPVDYSSVAAMTGSR
jgi:hypothetical protein